MRSYSITSWWSQRSLISRLLVSMVTVSVLIGAILLYTTVQSTSDNYRQELDEQLKDEISAFAPMLIEQAVIGDYASIQQMLELWVQRKDLMLAAWTDPNGKRIEARDISVLPETPAWFSAWANIPKIEAEAPLVLGGQSYGKVTMMLTSSPKMNLIWHAFLSQISIMLTGFLLILSLTVLSLPVQSDLARGIIPCALPRQRYRKFCRVSALSTI
jgi:hypothetical protein